MLDEVPLLAGDVGLGLRTLGLLVTLMVSFFAFRGGGGGGWRLQAWGAPFLPQGHIKVLLEPVCDLQGPPLSWPRCRVVDVAPSWGIAGNIDLDLPGGGFPILSGRAKRSLRSGLLFFMGARYTTRRNTKEKGGDRFSFSDFITGFFRNPPPPTSKNRVLKALPRIQRHDAEPNVAVVDLVQDDPVDVVGGAWAKVSQRLQGPLLRFKGGTGRVLGWDVPPLYQQSLIRFTIGGTRIPIKDCSCKEEHPKF